MSEPATFTGPALVWHRENGQLRLDILPESATAVFDIADVEGLLAGRTTEIRSGSVRLIAGDDGDFTAEVDDSTMWWHTDAARLREYAGLDLSP